MPASEQGRIQGIVDQSLIDFTAHLPANDLSAKQINHGGQVQPTFRGLNLRDVAPTHTSLGLLVLKLGSSKLGAVGIRWFESVVCLNLRLSLQRKPCLLSEHPMVRSRALSCPLF